MGRTGFKSLFKFISQDFFFGGGEEWTMSSFEEMCKGEMVRSALNTSCGIHRNYLGKAADMCLPPQIRGGFTRVLKKPWDFGMRRARLKMWCSIFFHCCNMLITTKCKWSAYCGWFVSFVLHLPGLEITAIWGLGFEIFRHGSVRSSTAWLRNQGDFQGLITH